MEQKTEAPQEQVVQVRADLLGDFQRLALLAAHHESLLAGLRKELAEYHCELPGPLEHPQ
jgi:hypothetical protein